MEKFKLYGYRERYTSIVFDNELMELACETGSFFLYNIHGKLTHRTFRQPILNHPDKSRDIKSLRPEEKFILAPVSKSIIAIKDNNSPYIQDLLVSVYASANEYDLAVFMYCSSVLNAYGYDNRGTNGYPTSYDLENKQIHIGTGGNVYSIERGNLIYLRTDLINVKTHVYSIFSDLRIPQYRLI